MIQPIYLFVLKQDFMTGVKMKSANCIHHRSTDLDSFFHQWRSIKYQISFKNNYLEMSRWSFRPLSTKHYMKCRFPLQHCWTVQPWEIRSVFYGDLDGWNGREVQEGGAIRIQRANSLHCIAEVNTTLWSNYIPIKNVMRKKEMQSLALKGIRRLPWLDSCPSSGRDWLPGRLSFQWWNYFSQPSPGTANCNKYEVDWKFKCKTCNQNMLE